MVTKAKPIEDFEKLGVFYLGKHVDRAGKLTDDLMLYPSKDLTTHAVCVGMTGSGKTGLGIALLEESGIDKIPAIIIDPKGDLTNLLLTFPDLSPEEFLPWIDKQEAERKGMQPEAYAKSVAKTWKDGLAEWQETADRIKTLRNAVEMVIYTPASPAGVQLSILSSFSAPPKEVLEDPEAFRNRISSITSSLLGLLGITADPIKSREHILISTILNQAWQKGINLDIASLIQQVQKPPIDKIGALDVDTFFPPKDRMTLSISLNSLLASPQFQAWMEGVPLDINQMLFTKEGKPKLAIITISHLSDTERMFFVTLLLNEFLSWMRRQTGTSSLRALLYMDEIFGYFPPTATPPSKLPMLTLLKQARAFGVGIVLATQNPVDLDYKGLANCGTWFIGKLQTERDKARVIEGLNTASNGELDAKSLDKLIASTGNRKFLMRSVHEKDPLLFETRWTLSYLRGPLTLAQIEKLTPKPAAPKEEKTTELQTKSTATTQTSTKPAISPGIKEYFARTNQQGPVKYIPKVVGLAKLHFVDAKNKVDTWLDIGIVASPDDSEKNVSWDHGKAVPQIKNRLDNSPLPNSTFEEVPAILLQEKNYAGFEKALAASLYQNQVLNIFYSPDLNLTSKENESEADFRSRMILALREKRDELIQKLRDKYQDKINTLTAKVQKAQEKMAQKQQESGIKKTESWVSFGATVLGAFFGKGVTKGTINEAGTAMRKMGRASKEEQAASQAEADYKAAMQQLDDLHGQLNDEISKISTTADANSLNIEKTTVRPRKSDITIEKVALLWWPADKS